MYLTNIELLNKKITEYGTSIEAIATKTGIGVNTFSRRIGSGKFLIGEIHKICSFLQLSPSEAKKIFMSQKIS